MVVVATLFGLMQGYLSTRLRIQAFIVTLAGLQAARGLALIASDNTFININYGDGPGNAPPAFAILGERLCGDTFPVATLVFLALAIVATFLLNQHTLWPLCFRGGRQRAARRGFRAFRCDWIKISVYALSGLCAGIAGIVHAGQFSFGSPNDGSGYELNAIAAVVIGGTDLFGGAGSMIGTIAGAVMLGALANILQLNDVSAAMQLLATGAIIVLAAGAANARRRTRRKLALT